MKPAPKPAALRRHLAPRQKVWLNWDGVFLMGPNYLRFLAAVDKTGTIREGGRAVGWSYRTYAYRQVGLWAGVFNGEGQNVTANADSTVLGMARLAVRLLPQLSLAVNGARYFGDSTRYGVDAAYEDARFGLKAEYLGQTRDEASGPDDWGWYGLGAVFVTPTVQAVGKCEEFARPGVNPALKNRAWTAGLNVYPSGRTFRLTFDYVSRKIGEHGVEKGRLLGQVQAKF